MQTRLPAVAGMFYPADEVSARREVARALCGAQLPELDAPIRGSVVPHAGWTYSGSTAARVFAAVHSQGAPETLVLFGAVHSWGVSRASMHASGSWRTPLADLLIDEALAGAVLDGAEGLIVDRPQAHAGEHSIEVQLPFIKYLFPETRILPIAVPPTEDAHRVGSAVARVVAAQGREVPAVASSDLTHYGPRYGYAPVGVGEESLAWARANDARLLALITTMRIDHVLGEAAAHKNACGAGAIVAAMAYASELGATKGIVLAQTTSHEEMPMGTPSDFVGYGAVVLL